MRLKKEEGGFWVSMQSGLDCKNCFKTTKTLPKTWKDFPSPHTTTNYHKLIYSEYKSLGNSQHLLDHVTKNVLPFSLPFLLAVLESSRNLSHTAWQPVSRWLVITLSPPGSLAQARVDLLETTERICPTCFSLSGLDDIIWEVISCLILISSAH